MRRTRGDAEAVPAQGLDGVMARCRIALSGIRAIALSHALMVVASALIVATVSLVLWVIVLYVVNGLDVSLTNRALLSGLLAFWLFAFVIALVGVGVIGLPVMLLFRHYGLNSPALISVLGAIIGVAFFGCLDEQGFEGLVDKGWAWVAFLAVPGGVAGFLLGLYGRLSKNDGR